MTQPGLVDDFNALWQHLLAHWTNSEQVWSDAVRRDFDKRYMAPLEQETVATMKEMAKLMEVIAKVQREVK